MNATSIHLIVSVTNKISAWLQSLGVQPGESVALIFDNCPEIYFLEIAILKLAAIPCYINANLRSTSLIHCINISGARVLVAEEVHAKEGVVPILDKINGVRLFCWGNAENPSIENIGDETFARFDGKTRLGGEARKRITFKDVAATIYTSGVRNGPYSHPPCHSFLPLSCFIDNGHAEGCVHVRTEASVFALD